MKKLIVLVSALLASQTGFAAATLHCETLVPHTQYICDLFTSGGSTVSNVDFFPGGAFGIIFEDEDTAIFKCLGSNNAGVANVTYILDGSAGSASQQLPCNNEGNNGSPNGTVGPSGTYTP